MIKENYKICSQCYEKIESKGYPYRMVLESILEVFYILEQPTAILSAGIYIPILEKLEQDRLIVTTEFPNEETDVILAIPTANLNDGVFCFDRKNHQ